MSLKNPYELPTDKLEKETQVQYDLLKDNFGIHNRKPDCDWYWDTWNAEYGSNVFTEAKQTKEVFKFFNKEIKHECNVPEPTVISFVLLGGIIALGLKRKVSK